MEEQPSLEEFSIPIHINNIAFPNDPELRRLHDLYKPPKELEKYYGYRTIFAHVFIENDRLGTLANLCIRCLAQRYGPDPLPMIASDPLSLQIHYDALDVDLPLEKCYHIASERFWKRVVLAKHPDKALPMRPGIKWKNLGVSLKYVEMVEASSVEYWPEEEMAQLAMKVQEYVREIHIKHLQSLQERSFEKYYRPRPPSSLEEYELTETESVTESVPTSEKQSSKGSFFKQEDEKTESQLTLEQQMAVEKAERKKRREILREEKAKARQGREAQRLRREAKLANAEATAKRLKRSKKRLKKPPTSFSEIEISESEDNEEQYILDRRNLELFLKYKKDYHYPPEHCHHIDLRFVQHFQNLETFTLEFLGPFQTRNYHKRHMNFSHDDIQRLAQGLSQLNQLRVFRLRYSRMNAEKLLTTVHALKALPKLEIVDFGYDNLQDDCAEAFFELFKNTSSIRHLELESNQLGEEAIRSLGKALQNYRKGCLEHLSLSRNPLTDAGLHNLVQSILGTPHISTLGLRGILRVTSNGLACCIANELLSQHDRLLKLDLTGVPMDGWAANEILKALNCNQTLLAFQCLGCGLDEESEQDIAVIMRRNKYIAENPYVGDQTKTNEEIDDWLNRTKNPILLKVLAEREKQNECLFKRSKERLPSTLSSREDISKQKSLNIYSSSSDSDFAATSDKEPFIYNANKFDEKEFLEHVKLPGPSNRYYYFKDFREKYALKENIKNISLL